MVTQLFSDRERGLRPRTSETVDIRAWSGLVAQIDKRVANGGFGAGFPEECPDLEGGIIGCNSVQLGSALRAEVDVDWPLISYQLPDDQLVIWDTLEFLFEHVGKPIQGKYHLSYGHHHISFDVGKGRQEFGVSINRILARNGIAFELTEEGEVRRLLPPSIREQISKAQFQTGDVETDRMLEAARIGITSPDFESRKGGLEKLWDAFERVKTLEPGLDKKTSADTLLSKVACGPKFRELLATEAIALTNAGNNLGIRHFETNQELLRTAQQVDYLFFRTFAFLQLLLRASGREI
jgi:hypothetical protein